MRTVTRLCDSKRGSIPATSAPSNRGDGRGVTVQLADGITAPQLGGGAGGGGGREEEVEKGVLVVDGWLCGLQARPKEGEGGGSEEGK